MAASSSPPHANAFDAGHRGMTRLSAAGHGQRERGVFGRAPRVPRSSAKPPICRRGATRAAQHHATHGVIGLEFAHETEFAIHVQREGIALLRAVHHTVATPSPSWDRSMLIGPPPVRRSSVPCSTTRPSSSSVASVTMVVMRRRLDVPADRRWSAPAGSNRRIRRTAWCRPAGSGVRAHAQLAQVVHERVIETGEQVAEPARHHRPRWRRPCLFPGGCARVRHESATRPECWH